MRQRVVIALALSADPKLIIDDEPTTALDVSIQAQIISLLKRLAHEHGASIMLITHDMGVIAETADRVAVLYSGEIVEIGNVADVISRPQHPYTKGSWARSCRPPEGVSLPSALPCGNGEVPRMPAAARPHGNIGRRLLACISDGERRPGFARPLPPEAPRPWERGRKA